MVFNSVFKMLLFHFFRGRRENNSITLLHMKENKTLGGLGHSRSLVVYSKLEFCLNWLFRGPVCTGKDVQEAPLLILPQDFHSFPSSPHSPVKVWDWEAAPAQSRNWGLLQRSVFALSCLNTVLY